MIYAGELSLLAQAEAYLMRIEELNCRLDAYLLVMVETLLAEVRTTMEPYISHRNDLDLLHGISLALKNFIGTRGRRTMAGSLLGKSHVAVEDTSVRQQLRQTGAVLLGKLKLHEWGFGITPVQPHVMGLDYVLAHRVQERSRREMRRLISTLDVLVLPATPIHALALSDIGGPGKKKLLESCCECHRLFAY